MIIILRSHAGSADCATADVKKETISPQSTSSTRRPAIAMHIYSSQAHLHPLD